MNSVLIQQENDEKRGIAMAIFLSILAHLLVLLILIFFLQAKGYIRLHMPQKKEAAPVEMIFIAPPQTSKPVYIPTTESQRTEKAPEQPVFESDKNTKAASELPAQGNLPVPTMEGRNANTLNFENHESVVGDPKQHPAPASVTQQPQPPTPPAEPAKPAQETPPEPKTQQAIREPQPNNIALLEPPVNKTAQAIKPVRETTPPAPNTQPAKASRPAYQPETKTTRMYGGISNRGRAAVAAVSTPLGRYKKILSDAIGSRWYYYYEQQSDLVNTGTVTIHFVVYRDGTVHQVKVVSNSSNEGLANCSVRSIMDAKIPPMAEDVATGLNGSKLEADFNFTIY
ncbi:MAG: energy transducer TonB [Chthoniobacterales bacterium]